MVLRHWWVLYLLSSGNWFWDKHLIFMPVSVRSWQYWGREWDASDRSALIKLQRRGASLTILLKSFHILKSFNWIRWKSHNWHFTFREGTRVGYLPGISCNLVPRKRLIQIQSAPLDVIHSPYCTFFGSDTRRRYQFSYEDKYKLVTPTNVFQRCYDC